MSRDWRISRRTWMAGVSAMAFAGPVAQAADRKLKVVVTGGRPGDPEYGCGGAIACHTDLGHNVILLYLKRGERNCPTTSADEGAVARVAEAQKACEILKAHAAFAGQCDGNALVDAVRYAEFRWLLDGMHPDVVSTHWPIDGHADRRAISNGEDTLMFPPPDYVDITRTEPRKRLACYAHASQAPDKFYALQSQVTRFRGIESGYAQAEAFVRHVQSPGDPLR